MINLTDDKTGLDWVRYDISNMALLIQVINEVNSWSTNEHVKKFISDKLTLNDFLIEYKNNNEVGVCKDIFYCFEGLEVVGVVLISSDNNFSVIDYIVVNPIMINKGIGTRIIESIKNNKKYFFRSKKIDDVYASVHSENLPSQKVFLKAGFRELKMHKSNETSFKKYYMDLSVSMQEKE